GEQYLFVNHRYIKHAYLNNAVFRSYENMIPPDHFPSYFLFITIDPSHIDVNIHPTKTEIKFEDERAVYQIVHAAVKMSLGKFHLAPMLDFENEPSMDFSKLDPERPVVQPKITVNPNYNPFDKESTTQKKPENWQKLFLQSDIPEMLPDENSEQKVISPEWKDENLKEDSHKPYSVHGKYIVTHIRSGLLIIDQHRAHTRILFEKIISNITAQKIASQQLLFPETMHLNAVDYDILKDLTVNLQSFGFELGDLGNGSMALYGVPSGIEADSPVKLIEEIIEDYKNHLQDSFSGALERMAASVASASSVKYGKTLSPQEMLFLIDELFACNNPNYTPGGKNIHFIVNIEEWDDRFGKLK
ncbi:MAG: DNA mismatch repair protein MutL, partial [Bacteroidota bacterium]